MQSVSMRSTAALTCRRALAPSSSANFRRHLTQPALAHRARNAEGARRWKGVVYAGWNDFTWGSAKVVSNEPAAKEGGLHSIVLSVDAETAAGYVKPGQFIQMRMSEDGKPAFIAIASPPTNGGAELEFLVKSTDGTAGEICALGAGADVGVSPVMGKGFDLSGASAADCPTALLFATGSGISPIRALITASEEAGGLGAGRDVTLYYGTSSPDATAFSGEIAAWEAAGVKVVQVNSPTYVQEALKGEIENVDAGKAAAVLCGQKEMTEEVIGILTEAGMPRENCIMNF